MPRVLTNTIEMIERNHPDVYITGMFDPRFDITTVRINRRGTEEYDAIQITNVELATLSQHDLYKMISNKLIQQLKLPTIKYLNKVIEGVNVKSLEGKYWYDTKNTLPNGYLQYGLRTQGWNDEQIRHFLGFGFKEGQAFTSDYYEDVVTENDWASEWINKHG